jgi:hypothetical protein
MSVLLGIKSHGQELGTKKGRACRASLKHERDQQKWKPVLRPIALAIYK